MADKTVKIVITIPESFRRQVKAKAALAGSNVSDAVRALLQAWIDGGIEIPEEETEA